MQCPAKGEIMPYDWNNLFKEKVIELHRLIEILIYFEKNEKLNIKNKAQAKEKQIELFIIIFRNVLAQDIEFINKHDTDEIISLFETFKSYQEFLELCSTEMNITKLNQLTCDINKNRIIKSYLINNAEEDTLNGDLCFSDIKGFIFDCFSSFSPIVNIKVVINVLYNEYSDFLPPSLIAYIEGQKATPLHCEALSVKPLEPVENEASIPAGRPQKKTTARTGSTKDWQTTTKINSLAFEINGALPPLKKIKKVQFMDELKRRCADADTPFNTTDARTAWSAFPQGRKYGAGKK